MSFKIEQGLFNLDFTDYHAILGIPVDAGPNDIRKQYLKIVRRLHPDSSANENEEDRKRASELLSKMVNPAYEKLSQEKNYTEYLVLLKLKGQQAQRQQETVLLTSSPARELAASSDIQTAYKATLKKLTDKQYENLSDTLDITGQISELNLVYLMRRDGQVEVPNTQGQSSTQSAARPTAPTPTTPKKPAPPSKAQLVEAYLRRASEFESKQDFPKAILELREAIQIDPQNSMTHSRLGMVYLKNKQLTMAKIHFNKALEINPEDEVALAGRNRVDPSAQSEKSQATKGKPAAKAPAKGKKPDQSGGGLFGLFGGKKK